jgi:hypothetical protein|uniref:RING-type E3 ubiquitin transferase n=1 Tax=Populus trichocarpa TaxID=3694 RepID=A0A2K1YXI7_POPTR
MERVRFALSGFEEGEELRTLPECLHSYHVACIDMWFFYSHSNCPICRTDATPSQVFPNARVLDSEGPPRAYRNGGVLQGVVVHSRAI